MSKQDELLLTPEEMEIAVNKWKNEDWATRYVSLNRGHYEDILPVVAQAQLAKARPIIDAEWWDLLEGVILAKDLECEDKVEEAKQEGAREEREKIYQIIEQDFGEVSDLFAGYGGEARKQFREAFEGFGVLVTGWLKEKQALKEKLGGK